MNSPQGVLAGRGVVVTRPRAQAEALAQLIENSGGRAMRFAALEIEPLENAALTSLIDRLEGFDTAIFISRNAVAQGLARVRARRAWPDCLAVAAIGAGTRRALEAEGMRAVLAPEGTADSEALLALAPFQSVSGKRIVIFRGAGGRELLAETLRARGSLVEYAECYRRSVPATDPGPLVEVWSHGAVDAVVISSGEGLANLCRLVGERGRALLAGTPVFVPHARVASEARALGVAHAVIAGTADADVLAALVAYFRRAG